MAATAPSPSFRPSEASAKAAPIGGATTTIGQLKDKIGVRPKGPLNITAAPPPEGAPAAGSDAFFPPPGSAPIKTLCVLDIAPPGPDNPAFNTLDDKTLWGYGGDMLSLSALAARQDINDFIAANKLDATKTSDLDVIESKVAYYAYEEFQSMFSGCVVPSQKSGYKNSYSVAIKDLNAAVVANLLRDIKLAPEQLTAAEAVLGDMCANVKRLQAGWTAGRKDQSMAVFVRYLETSQVGTTQLGLRFFVANFTADTFKLLAGKGSSTKLTLNSAFLSTTGFLNRQVFAPQDDDVKAALADSRPALEALFKIVTVPAGPAAVPMPTGEPQAPPVEPETVMQEAQAFKGLPQRFKAVK